MIGVVPSCSGEYRLSVVMQQFCLVQFVRTYLRDRCIQESVQREYLRDLREMVVMPELSQRRGRSDRQPPVGRNGFAGGSANVILADGPVC